MAAGNVVSRPGSDLSGGLPMQFEPLGQDGHFANGWLQAMAKLSDAMRGYWGFRKVTGGIGQQSQTYSPYNTVGAFVIKANQSGAIDLGQDVLGIAVCEGNLTFPINGGKFTPTTFTKDTNCVAIAVPTSLLTN